MENKSIYDVIRGVKNRVLQQIARHIYPNAMRIKLHRARGVKIGDNTFIGKYVVIDDTRPEYVSIGSNVGIALYVVILSHRRDISEYRQDYGYNDYPLVYKKVIISDNVQIGCRSIILPGVTVGRSSIIAAGSVVTKDVPPFTLVAGCPAKVIKTFVD